MRNRLSGVVRTRIDGLVPMNPRPPRFESVFEQLPGNGKEQTRYRIRGSGVHTEPLYAPHTHRIVNFLEQHGVNVSRRSLGSPANVTSHHLAARFRDGGLKAMTGNYWMQSRGAWLDGPSATAWVAHGLGLRPPASPARTRAPALPDALRHAYAGTDFVLMDDPGHPIRIGHLAPSRVAARMAEHQACRAWIITACNPFSQTLSTLDNELRQAFLACDLDTEALTYWQAEGRDPDGQWPGEPSFLVLVAEHADASAWLTRYQQHALVQVNTNQPATLVFHPYHATSEAGR